MKVFGNTAKQDRMVGQYSTEFEQLMRASRNYVEATQSTWAANSVNVITIPNLIAAGQLPTAWGTRTTGTDRTPLGNVWRIVAIRNATGAGSRIVVSETGAANGDNLEDIGLLANGQNVMSIKSRVASQLAARKIAAGTIPGGGTVATGAGANAWTKDVSAFFSGATPTQPVVAGFMGFTDLDLVLDPNPNNASRWGDCPIAEATQGSYGLPAGNGTCPAGTTEVGSWPACPPGGAAVVYAVGFQAVTAGLPVAEYRGALGTTCTEASNWRVPPCNQALQNEFNTVTHTINSSVVSRSVCSVNIYNDYGMVFNWPQQLVANPGPRHKLCCYPKQ
jgi:hypothetical protein